MNPYGATRVPEGNDFVAVAGGGNHGLAIKCDGSLVGWGDNSQGQSNVPPGNDFTAIAGGAFYSLALREDGSLVAWGANHWGESDVPAGNNFVAMAAGSQHGLAIQVPEPSTILLLWTLAATLGLFHVLRRHR